MPRQAFVGEHHNMAPDGVGVDIGYFAACEGGLHRGNLGDEGSGLE